MSVGLVLFVLVVGVDWRLVPCSVSGRYWPTVPGYFPELKACIFDNLEDPNGEDPLFYRTSVQMGQ